MELSWICNEPLQIENRKLHEIKGLQGRQEITVLAQKVPLTH